MSPTPNFGVFLDLAHPFLTEVDFKSETYTKKIVNTLHWNVSGVNILQ